MNTEQTTIRLPLELKEKLQRDAAAKGYTLKDLILFVLHDWIKINSRSDCEIANTLQ